MIAKKERLTNKPKDYMLRVRIDETLLNKLDTVVESKVSSRSHVIREGIERLYDELDKKNTL